MLSGVHRGKSLADFPVGTCKCGGETHISPSTLADMHGEILLQGTSQHAYLEMQGGEGTLLAIMLVGKSLKRISPAPKNRGQGNQGCL